MPTPSFHVIDGTAALFRAYFGMNRFRSPDDIEMGGVMGMTQFVARVIKTFGPSHVAMVWDTDQPTFRHKMTPEYKANREAPPEGLEPQFSLAYDACQALGLKSFRVVGYEADDLMATLARRAKSAGLETYLVTPDKDVLQLVSEGVHVVEPKGLGVLGPADVMERFGVSPDHLTDLLALAGDASDNIPGVRGVGPKTASALVAAMGSVSSIYESLDQVANVAVRGAKTLGAKLADQRDAAFLSRRLVELDADVPLGADALTLGDLRLGPPPEDADALFDRLGFHGPLRTLRAHFA